MDDSSPIDNIEGSRVERCSSVAARHTKARGRELLRCLISQVAPDLGVGCQAGVWNGQESLMELALWRWMFSPPTCLLLSHCPDFNCCLERFRSDDVIEWDQIHMWYKNTLFPIWVKEVSLSFNSCLRSIIVKSWNWKGLHKFYIIRLHWSPSLPHDGLMSCQILLESLQGKKCQKFFVVVVKEETFFYSILFWSWCFKTIFISNCIFPSDQGWAKHKLQDCVHVITICSEPFLFHLHLTTKGQTGQYPKQFVNKMQQYFE